MLAAAGCPSDEPSQTDGGASSGTTAGAASTGPGATVAVDTTAGAATSNDSSGDGIIEDFGNPSDLPPPSIDLDCRDTPPDGAAVAPPLPTYDGTCPMLVPGANTIDSSGNAREFLLVVPADLDPSERVPVIFLWHWLGGDAPDFLDQGDVQNAVDMLRFVAVIPSSKGDLPFQWPITQLDSPARYDEEFQFFDDMLACVAEQFEVEENCVSTAGVSAGGLFTSQLAAARSEHLASFLSLSGGTGGALLPAWGGASHKLPAMVLWGGPDDFCIAIDFNNTSLNMEADLDADNHFILECVHNCAHAAPPFDVAADRTDFAPLWRFVLAHPYWLEDGDSPYLEAGVPGDMPEWCGIGPGGATPREGECGPSQC